MPINRIHFNKFLDTLNNFEDQVTFGHIPNDFFNGIILRLGANQISTTLLKLQNNLPNQRLTRAQVFNICEKNLYSFEYKVICILSWGGMRQTRTSADLFFLNWELFNIQLENILTSFKNGMLKRLLAYDQILELNTPGCGPAYFTKLLFFFNRGGAYIMDQWTSKSIELLWEEDNRIGILFDHTNNYITRANTGMIYEMYCTRVEKITQIINLFLDSEYTPTEIEERIFSNGGNNPGEWREYIRNNTVSEELPEIEENTNENLFEEENNDNPIIFKVTGSNGEIYTITKGETWICTCKAFRYDPTQDCKHIISIKSGSSL